MKKLILDESKAILEEPEDSIPAVDLGGELDMTLPPQVESGDIIPPEVEKNAFKDLMNIDIQNEWNNISDLNSHIATLVAEQQSEEVINILKSIVDEKTVQVGMLTKALELIDSKNKELMDAGIEKAEEIISEPANDLNKE